MDNIPRVYIETSVISGYGRERFHDTLIKFFDLIRSGVFIPIISRHTLLELNHEHTPIQVIENLQTIEFIEYPTTSEMLNLAEKYINKKIIDSKYDDDAMHIAIATLLEVDVLVSWNLTHIVNKNTIPLFNKINIKEGYKTLEIKKPEEIM